ncbi:MAG TPA: LamG domain-containing protein [Candidatus Angelobacter sp.]|nr:LamG domain-containing protein [Candidatus Angelobacter sp.]
MSTLTTGKRTLLTLSALLAVSTAFAGGKLPISSQGLVLWIQKVPTGIKTRDLSGNKNNAQTTSLIVSNSPSLVSMQDTHQLTLAMWMKPNSIPDEFPVPISKGGYNTPGADGGYELNLNWNGDNDLIFLSGNYQAETAGANGSLINNHLGEWIHVVVTVDTAAQVIQFYVNGQAYPNITSFGSLADVNFNVTNNLYIGEPDPAANVNRAPYDGEMQDVMVFNRTLSADEVQTLFTATTPGAKPGRRR